jgi:glycosyltransferase involved in cell wall biosynthesis
LKLAVVNLTNGGLSGGYAKYLHRLIPMLHADPRVTGLSLFMPPGIGWTGPQGVNVATWPQHDARALYRGLRERVRAQAPDIVFIPTARWLDFGGIPTVVMVRNMEPLTTPFGGNPWAEGLRNLGRAHAARLACERATRVIAVSQHVATTIIDRWKIGRDKIGLVYHGVDPPPAAEHTRMPAALQGAALNQFIFAAGSIRPARGLEDALSAMARLSGRDAVTLVIAGWEDYGMSAYRRRLQRLAADLCGDRVVWTGKLTPPEMAWCFANCSVFLTTSRAEACPNTTLEALSHGCVVIAPQMPPMPEFLATSAFSYRPEDTTDLATQIESALAATAEERRRRSDAARQRARDFPWAETAQHTLRQLELAVPETRAHHRAATR